VPCRPIVHWSAGAIAGQKEGVAARDKLRDGVEDALLSLGTGFYQIPGNSELRETVTYRRVAAAGILRRIAAPGLPVIFLFAAEDRNLLQTRPTRP